MNQAYWVDPLDRRRLLEAVFTFFGDGARVAIEGEAGALVDLHLDSFVGTVSGPIEPFRREYGPQSAMLVVPLQSRRDSMLLLDKIMPTDQLAPGVEAIQLEFGGKVQLLIGDAFDRECVSVGPLVSESLLHELVANRVIAGFFNQVEAKAYFRNVRET